ncbi:hypothetical protein [Ruegeria arenilitoris]|uniref:hypothetical protein n=1 Tax=Ruegeria arenilitoris TaxID=1173585 RepID=UPI00147C32BD|nr:hypothetical protein [Ruegeria arenilitoris]
MAKTAETAAGSTDLTDPIRITIMEAPSNRPQTKRFHPSGVERSRRAKFFRPDEVEIQGSDDLAKLIQSLATEPCKVIVMGAVRAAFRDQTSIRRLAHPKEDCAATLEDSGSILLHFDVDDLVKPDHLGWADPAVLAKWAWDQICQRLPTLNEVSVVWQASSSAAILGKEHLAKFHFWCLADRPLHAFERRHLFQLVGSDTSLAAIAQPNYTANPIFDGFEDPLKGLPRSGKIEGTKERLDTSGIAFPSQGKEKLANPRPASSAKAKDCRKQPAESQKLTSRLGQELLSKACEQIRNNGASNPAIFNQAQLIGGYVAGGEIALSDAQSALLSAAQSTGYARADEVVENGLKTGMGRPISAVAPAMVTEPFHPAPTLPREDSISRHAKILETWGIQAMAFHGKAWKGSDRPHNETAPRALLAGAQGIGKTAFLVGRSDNPGFLHSTHGLISLMLLPNHQKAEEALADYLAYAPSGSPPAVVLRGRSRLDPAANDSSTTMCRAIVTAQHLSEHGVSVRSTLCKKCPFQTDCGYLRQEADIKHHLKAKAGLVIFAPHEFAYLPLPGEAKPDLAVFDERPRDFAVEEVHVSLKELEEVILPPQRGFTRSREARDEEVCESLFVQERAIQPVKRALLGAAGASTGLSLKMLRSAGVTREMLDQAIADLETLKPNNILGILGRTLGGRSAEATHADLSLLTARLKSSAVSPVHRLQFLFECLRQEIEREHEMAVSVFIRGPYPDDHAWEPCISAVRVKELKHGREVPFLYLDGTTDPDMARIAFGADLDCHRYPVERHAVITQVLGCNFAKRRLCDETQGKQALTPKIQGENQRLKAWLEEVIARYPKAAVFGNRSVIKSLSISDPERAGHFGALRGQNKWEQHEAAIIIGREQPPLVDVEATARAYAAAAGDDFSSGDFVTTVRGIRTKKGVLPTEVKAHRDPWGDRVLRQIREAEIEQAMDRVRLIHNPKPKQVILLSPVVVDVTVDRIEPWRTFKKGGSRVAQAIARHAIVFLSPTDCAKYMPDIWASKQLAATDLPPAKEMSKDPCRFIYEGGFDGKCPLHVAFWPETQSGRKPRRKTALVFGEEADVWDRLEALTGPLAKFQVFRTFLSWCPSDQV